VATVSRRTAGVAQERPAEPPAPTEGASQPKPSLARDFWLVFSGQAISMQGDGLAGLALLWWIVEKTGSVTIATTLSMLSMLPVIFLGPVAGGHGH